MPKRKFNEPELKENKYASRATVVAVCYNYAFYNIPVEQVNITNVLKESNFNNYFDRELVYVMGKHFLIKLIPHDGTLIDKSTTIVNTAGEHLWPPFTQPTATIIEWGVPRPQTPPDSPLIVGSENTDAESDDGPLIFDNWTSELSDEKIQEYQETVQRLQQIAKENQITAEKILKANISDDNKAKAMVLYDRLKNCEPFSFDYNYTSHKIKALIEKEDSGDTSTFSEIKEKLKSLLNLHDSLETRIFKAEMDDNRKSAIYEQYLQYEKMQDESNSKGHIEEWIEEALKTPFTKTVSNECSLEALKKGFTDKLSSLDTVLEPLLTIFNNRINNPNSTSLVIGLLGSPGVGKTAVGQTIAETWGIPFKQISLGGMLDSSILSGQHRGWLGSAPGRFTKALQEMKAINGVIFLDEIDKLGTTERGMQVQHSLLHAIDPVQNTNFIDNYLGPRLPLDLSKCIFICALNTTEGLDPALLNRMHIIKVPDYTSKQKSQIMKDHLFPQALKNAGLDTDKFILSDEACSRLHQLVTSNYGEEGGVRNVKSGLRIIADKISLVLNNTPEQLQLLNIKYKIPRDDPPLTITREIVDCLYTFKKEQTRNPMYQ